MPDHEPDARRHGRSLLLAAAGAFALAVALHWSWNVFAVEVLGLDAIRFKHAVALALLAACAGGILALALRIAGAGQRPA